MSHLSVKAIAGAAVAAIALMATSGTAFGQSGGQVPQSLPMHGLGTLAGASKPVQLSLNWSGYAATSTSKFNKVHTEFVQPKITCDGRKFNWTSAWVGIDGFASNTVEQDGTFASCGGPDHMTPRYFAWYELFPAAAVSVFKVNPGDVIAADVTFAHKQFTLTITDVTRGRSATTSAECAQCQRTSAEWIVERPALCNAAQTNCFITELANFHRTTFTSAIAGVDGGTAGPISQFDNIPIDIDQPKGNSVNLLDQTESLLGSGTSFDVVWQRHGKIFPITL